MCVIIFQQYATAKRSKYGDKNWVIRTVDSLEDVEELVRSEYPDQNLEKFDESLAAEYGWEVSCRDEQLQLIIFIFVKRNIAEVMLCYQQRFH